VRLELPVDRHGNGDILLSGTAPPAFSPMEVTAATTPRSLFTCGQKRPMTPTIESEICSPQLSCRATSQGHRATPSTPFSPPPATISASSSSTG
jgi:hypothetical protein